MCGDRVSTWLNELRIIDGGFGSEATSRSDYKIAEHKAWSCLLLQNDPSLVVDIHKSYLRAGCDIISTNTYQAAPQTLADALDVEEVVAKELMRKAVCLAKRAIDEVMKEEAGESSKFKRKLYPLIAGSLGPYGACQADGSEYTGSYIDCVALDDLVQFHLKRAEILLEAGVDFIAWETIPSHVEVCAISRVMQLLPESALAWVSVGTEDGQTTARGEPLHRVAHAIRDNNKIFGVGINCQVPLDSIRTAIANVGGLDLDSASPNDDDYHPNPSQRQQTSSDITRPKTRPKILIAYPNSGERWVRLPPSRRKCNNLGGYWIWPLNTGPDDWALAMAQHSVTREMVETSLCQTANEISRNHGLAQWVGGCCRVTPNNIAQLVMLIKPDEFADVAAATLVGSDGFPGNSASSSATATAAATSGDQDRVATKKTLDCKAKTSKKSLKRTRSEQQVQPPVQKAKRRRCRRS